MGINPAKDRHACHSVDAEMIDLSAFHALAHAPLGTFGAKPTSIEGNQQEASRLLWTSADEGISIGIWECTPGRFTADRSKASEFCHLISGRIEMTHADGRKVQLGPGDAINLPLGWKGEWRVLEQVRKLYVMTRG
jgi:uncharacterized cupin superfamily protein